MSDPDIRSSGPTGWTAKRRSFDSTTSGKESACSKVIPASMIRNRAGGAA
jgi:hypothetical protein